MEAKFKCLTICLMIFVSLEYEKVCGLGLSGDCCFSWASIALWALCSLWIHAMKFYSLYTSYTMTSPWMFLRMCEWITKKLAHTWHLVVAFVVVVGVHARKRRFVLIMLVYLIGFKLPRLLGLGGCHLWSFILVKSMHNG